MAEGWSAEGCDELLPLVSTACFSFRTCEQFGHCAVSGSSGVEHCGHEFSEIAISSSRLGSWMPAAGLFFCRGNPAADALRKRLEMVCATRLPQFNVAGEPGNYSRDQFEPGSAAEVRDIFTTSG